MRTERAVRPSSTSRSMRHDGGFHAVRSRGRAVRRSAGRARACRPQGRDVADRSRLGRPVRGRQARHRRRACAAAIEDPHFVPAKPSLMKAIQHADVYISTGLELDGGLAAAGAARQPQPADPARREGLRGRFGGRRRAREAVGHGEPRRGRRPPARQPALLPRPEGARGRGRSSGARSSPSSTRRTRPTTPPTPRRSTSAWRRR